MNKSFIGIVLIISDEFQFSFIISFCISGIFQ